MSLTETDTNRPRRARGRAPWQAVVVLLILSGVLAAVVVWQWNRSAHPTPPTESTRADIAASTIPASLQGSEHGILAEEYVRIDPRNDGWNTEVFHEAVKVQLAELKRLVAQPDDVRPDQLVELISADFECEPLRPVSAETCFRDAVLSVERAAEADSAAETAYRGVTGCAQALDDLRRPLQGAKRRAVKLKVFRVDLNDSQAETVAYFQASGQTGSASVQQTSVQQTSVQQTSVQQTARWHLRWTRPTPDQQPRLLSIRVEDFDETTYRGQGPTLFADCTAAVLGESAAYRDQLAYGTDHWRTRLSPRFDREWTGLHGIAVGDVNGDGLDDVYVSQPGGLPNRLLVQNEDGTARDVSAAAGVDWLDTCHAGLLVDLDNDGDQDLALAAEVGVMLMSNNGAGQFVLERVQPTPAPIYTLAAADYDLDGDLDVYAAAYRSAGDARSQGVLAFPVPYHDANNGGANVLLRNNGGWQFADATAEVGLDQNNRRFSLAAAWEDYDNDGDDDLYVANDFGRNNLYRNDGGLFRDVAAEAGVEDTSAGMSVSWGDYNRDGWMDLYVSNMFSAAGNRITYQPKFKQAAETGVRAQFQRHARGNSLFAGSADGKFVDVSLEAGVTMGGWAYGSRFVDLNSDGWEDLVVCNGFMTQEDPHDL